MNLLALLQQRFRDALAGLVSDPARLDDFVAMVKPAQDEKRGDYQANMAMKLAKELGKKPPEVAQEIVGRLKIDDILEPPAIAGGFISLRFKSDWLAAQVAAMEANPRLGVAPGKKPERSEGQTPELQSHSFIS